VRGRVGDKNHYLLSVLADYHFAPTERSRVNLIKEGVASQRIWVTGNTVVDALLDVVKRQNSKKVQAELEKYFYSRWKIPIPEKNLSKSEILSPRLILVTGHRRESFGEKFKNICFAIKDIAKQRSDVIFVYPVHLNPNVQTTVKSLLGGIKNIFLIEPIEYEHFVFLMNKAFLILTDSGGIQEEAPSLGKPVLLMRETTERPEGVEAGVVKILGTDKKMIVANTINLLNDFGLYQKMAKSVNPFGDGKASERIAKIVTSLLSKKDVSVSQ
jgi:UDP-N-acetylglucosamine 2-epimerase (non-hydrolysing)